MKNCLKNLHNIYSVYKEKKYIIIMHYYLRKENNIYSILLRFKIQNIKIGKS